MWQLFWRLFGLAGVGWCLCYSKWSEQLVYSSILLKCRTSCASSSSSAAVVSGMGGSPGDMGTG